jgi:hypothetical protein
VLWCLERQATVLEEDEEVWRCVVFESHFEINDQFSPLSVRVRCESSMHEPVTCAMASFV